MKKPRKRSGKPALWTQFAPSRPSSAKRLLDRLAETAFWETGRLSSFSAVTPFVSTAVLNRIAVEVLRQDGPRGIAPLLPFVDSRILVDYLNGALNE